MSESDDQISSTEPVPPDEVSPAERTPLAEDDDPVQPPDLGDASEVGEGAADLGELDDASLDELLKHASFEDPNVSESAVEPIEDGEVEELPAIDLPELEQAVNEAQGSSVDLLKDVDLNVKIELGRARMLVEEVLKLVEGSVVELDKLAGDPVDVFVNDRLVARGEVLVLNDTFCVRINEILAPSAEDLS